MDGEEPAVKISNQGTADCDPGTQRNLFFQFYSKTMKSCVIPARRKF